MKVLQPLGGLRGLPGLRGGLPNPDSFSVFKRGPLWTQALTNPLDTPTIFWPPPLDFDGAHTSKTEWMPYAAFALIFGVPTIAELRHGPYLGGPPFWTYQTFVSGGRSRATSADFVIYPSSQQALPMVVRIQTEQYHLFTTEKVQQFDRQQRVGLSRGFIVKDMYDYQWLTDTTGRAVMYFARRVLSSFEPSAQLPNTAGHARRSRYAR